MTEADLLSRLAARFCAPAWAFLPQVRNGTGWERKARTADAVAMGLWPSRGLDLIAFEVKVARSDWLRELREPEKADDIFRFVDQWYVVAEKGLVQPGELPSTWGLMVPRGKQLIVATEAPKLAPQPVDRLFLASLCRNIMGNLTPEAVLKNAHAEGRKEGIEEGGRIMEAGRKAAEEDLAVMRKKLHDFERAAGINIDGWTPPKMLGEAVRLVLTGEDSKARERLEIVRRQAKDVLDGIEKALGRDACEANDK